MLQIQIGASFLDLPVDAKLSYIVNSPLFSTELTDGQYSFPFNIPASLKNKKILQFPDRADNAIYQNVYYDVVLYDNGIKLPDKYQLYVNTANSQVYQCYVVNNDFQLKNNLDISLKKIGWQDITISTNQLAYVYIKFTRYNTSGSGSIIVAGDVINFTFFPDIQDTYFNVAHGINFTVAGTCQAQQDANGVLIATTANVSSSYSIIIDTNDTNTDILVVNRGFIMPWDDMKTHMDNTNANIPGADHVFFPVYNPGYFGDITQYNKNLDSNGGFTYDYSRGLINDYDPVGHHFNTYPGLFADYVTVAAVTPLYPVIPFVFLSTILDQISTFLGFNMDFELFNENTEWLNTVFYNNFNLLTAIGNSAYGAYSSIINYANHVPDITIKDFLLELKTLLNLSFFIDNEARMIRVVVNEPLIKSDTYQQIDNSKAADDLIQSIQYHVYATGYKIDTQDAFCKGISETLLFNTVQKPDVDNVAQLNSFTSDNNNDIRYVKNRNAYYIFRKDIIQEFYTHVGTPAPTFIHQYQFLCNNLLQYQQGLPVTDSIASAISPICMTEVVLSNENILLPAINALGSTTLFGIGNNDFALRICIYRGIFTDILDSVNISYPFANINQYAPIFGNVRWATSLVLGIPSNGLYQSNWQRWLSMLALEKDNQKNMSFTLDDVLNLDLTRKQLIEFVPYLIRSVILEIPVKQPVQLLMAKINNNGII